MCYGFEIVIMIIIVKNTVLEIGAVMVIIKLF
jgi:hypothetical protein